jgi:hypothetical protein
MALSITDTQHKYAECLHAECLHAECLHGECRYAECHYAKCRDAKWHYAELLGIIFLTVVDFPCVISNFNFTWFQIKRNIRTFHN